MTVARSESAVNRKQFLALTSMAIAAVGSPAQAANWLQVGSSDQRAVYIDAASLRWRDDFATFWAMLKSARSAAPGDGNYLVELSCSTQQIRLAVQPGSDMAANPFGSANGSPYLFQPATGPIPSALMARVCRMRPPQQVRAAPSAIPPQPVAPGGRIAGPPLGS